jgi:hypothetical protein
MGELKEVDNIATFSGHSALTSSVTFSAPTNQVIVTSTDAPTTVTTTKTVDSTVAACATVRYKVVVDNTQSGADESVALSVLTDDKFGSITSVHDKVVATTCSVPKTVAAGDKYSCTFDAQFCTDADSGLDGNGCFTHTNTINTVTLTGDDANDVGFNQASNSLTVTECIAAK